MTGRGASAALYAGFLAALGARRRAAAAPAEPVPAARRRRCSRRRCSVGAVVGATGLGGAGEAAVHGGYLVGLGGRCCRSGCCSPATPRTDGSAPLAGPARGRPPRARRRDPPRRGDRMTRSRPEADAASPRPRRPAGAAPWSPPTPSWRSPPAPAPAVQIATEFGAAPLAFPSPPPAARSTWSPPSPCAARAGAARRLATACCSIELARRPRGRRLEPRRPRASSPSRPSGRASAAATAASPSPCPSSACSTCAAADRAPSDPPPPKPPSKPSRPAGVDGPKTV